MVFPGEGRFGGREAAVVNGYPELRAARAELLLCRREKIQGGGLGMKVVLMVGQGRWKNRGMDVRQGCLSPFQ